VTVGRDDLCPCGSGTTYERCCLGRDSEVRRLVEELEAQVSELALATWDRDRDWYVSRFAEFYDGGISAFGHAGPGAEARLEAELWFLLDCPLDSGVTPLHRVRQRTGNRAVELLVRSELRAWRIESIDAPGLLGALCPLGTGRARLETAGAPLGELRPGAILVARSVPIGPRRWAVLGRARVVDRAAVADFDALLAVLDAPRGEFWRVHGGVLARAASAWPEDREHTVDGDCVEASLVAFGLPDAASAVAALRADPELEWLGAVAGAERGCESLEVVAGAERGLGWLEASAGAERGLGWLEASAGAERGLGWLEASAGAERGTVILEQCNWLWDPPRARAALREPGVRYRLCDEDACDRPVLARILIDHDIPEICLLAPTPARLGLAERLLADRLGPALGAVTLREVDPPNVVPRWKRAAFERDRRLARPARRARRAA
jgi:hypothetical protein